MVLKFGPDWSVQPGIGHRFSKVKIPKTGQNRVILGIGILGIGGKNGFALSPILKSWI